MLRQLCFHFTLRLVPVKYIAFATNIRLCSRLLSGNGLRYDPKTLKGLVKLEPPTTGALLLQFVYSMQWVKNGIPQFAGPIEPLHIFMERAYSCTEKRSKCSVAKVQLSSMGWELAERTAFDAGKDVLSNQVTLSH